MKKFLAILLAMMLVLSMGAVALADETEEEQPTTSNTATLAKVVVITNGDTSAPAETFEFEITNESVTDAAEGVTVSNMLTPTIGKAEFTEKITTETTQDITITMPEYKSVGIYTYKIKETAGKTAGMQYDTKEVTLKVTVENDKNGGFKVAGSSLVDSDNKKHDTFKNVYNAGSLSVSKTVTGALGDKTKYFEFQVTLTGEQDKKYAESFAVTSTSNVKNPTTIEIDKAATFYLKNNETITIANIPYDVTYTVTESDYKNDGYTTKVGDVETNTANGTIKAASETVAFTNTKDGNIDTGITTDSLPYVMLLGLVVLAGAALILKRRMAHNN